MNTYSNHFLDIRLDKDIKNNNYSPQKTSKARFFPKNFQTFDEQKRSITQLPQLYQREYRTQGTNESSSSSNNDGPGEYVMCNTEPNEMVDLLNDMIPDGATTTCQGQKFL